MTITCIHCFAEQSIEIAIEHEAGRDYMRLLLSQPPALQRGLSAYVWMFRSAKRNLTYERRLKIAGEVLALGAEPRALAAALSDTVEALRQKREQGDVRPLTGHNYLKQVLKTVALVPLSPTLSHEGRGGQAKAGSSPLPLWEGQGEGASVPKGKRRQAIELLRDWAHGSNLRIALVNGLSGLVAIGRPGTPAADMITANADMWLHWLTKHGLVESDEDCARVYSAFSGLVQQPLKEWPEPAVLAAHLPRRKPQPRIEGEHKSAEQVEANRKAAKEACAALERRLT